MAVLLNRTVYGRSVTAFGQNTRAARLAGVPIERIRYLTYSLSAVLAAVCGVFLAGFSGGSSLNMGEEYLLASIAVVVIGGSSIAGGNSNVPGDLRLGAVPVPARCDAEHIRRSGRSAADPHWPDHCRRCDVRGRPQGKPIAGIGFRQKSRGL